MIINTIYVSQQCPANFSNIQGAIDYAASIQSNSWINIIIFAGDYYERVYLAGTKIRLIGVGKVRIYGNLSAKMTDSAGKLLGTFRTATMFVMGKEIDLFNLTIINNAGPGDVVGQAIAVYCQGNAICFKKCQLIGYQDTLFLGPLPLCQKDGTAFVTEYTINAFEKYEYFFENCIISGTVDFIFGSGTAYFISTYILVRHCRNPKTRCYVTAASTVQRKCGFTFINCTIMGKNQPYYLGRPWRQYANVKFIGSEFDHNLVKEGWDDWDNPDNRNTAHFSEIACQYHGSTEQRVSWVEIIP